MKVPVPKWLTPNWLIPNWLISSWFTPSSKTIYVAFFALVSFFGSFSLYFSSLTLFVDESHKIFLDSTTLAHVAGEFTSAVVMSGFMANLMAAVAWAGFLQALSKNNSNWKEMSLEERKRTLRLAKSFKRNEIYVRSGIFIFLASILVIGVGFGLIFSMCVVMLGIGAWRFFGRMAGSTLILKLQDPKDLEARVKITAAVLIIAASSYLLGIVKNLAINFNLVEISTPDGQEVRALLYKTSNGLIFGPIVTEGDFPLKNVGIVTFVPFDQILRVESRPFGGSL